MTGVRARDASFHLGVVPYFESTSASREALQSALFQDSDDRCRLSLVFAVRDHGGANVVEVLNRFAADERFDLQSRSQAQGAAARLAAQLRD